ncbi:hypothetical protein SELMODRAFT_97970 [Selaginella moellendorffii]|uniref:MLO-like protein n=1 Tax=Selaginella moellendorffii TaxID=88036 RepID=D8RPA4_SELML|nr:hypothetical protein SELMODRAFT_97970 [Selaginella moellendorffii]
MEHGGGGFLEHSSLEQTPTWAVAGVCTVFVLLSLLLERGIHQCGKRLKKKNQKPLSQALEKMKEELMLMGFISLLLSVFQPLVSELCIPRSLLKHMLPCKLEESSMLKAENPSHTNGSFHDRRALLGWFSREGADKKCIARGEVPMISVEGLHQLHIFIFVMAIVHLCYSCLTMFLGRIMVYWWRRWEDEVRVVNKGGMFVDSFAFIFFRELTRGLTHARQPWSRLNAFNWIASFLRHLLCKPVTRADYMTLRRGFVRVSVSYKNYNLRREFDFHGYITRVLEDDFKVVVGIRQVAYLWAFVIMFLLMNVHGWHTYFWMAFLPLVLILVIGTKLQYIITELACEIAEVEDKAGRESEEVPAIKPRDDLFWFKRPRFLLHLIHFTLFQNAFELAFFFWVWATFGFDTCFMDSIAFIVVRLFVGAAVQFLCSYSTLPLYVLVTQMGSHYSKAIFTKRINKGVRHWHHGARSNVRQARIKQEERCCEEELKDDNLLDEIISPAQEEVSETVVVASPVHRILEIEMHGADDQDFAVVQVVEETRV